MAFIEEVFPLRIDFRPIDTLPIYQVNAAPRNPNTHDEGMTCSITIRARDAQHARRIVGRYMPKLRVLSVAK